MLVVNMSLFSIIKFIILLRLQYDVYRRKELALVLFLAQHINSKARITKIFPFETLSTPVRGTRDLFEVETNYLFEKKIKFYL